MTTPRTHTARRITTRLLYGLARAMEPVGIGGLAALFLCALTETGPHAGAWTTIVWAAAVYGAVRGIESVALDAAAWMDPDACDGAIAASAAAILHQLRDDLANGADPEDVRRHLSEANVGTALGDLAADLAMARDRSQTGSGDPLWTAAYQLRQVDHLIDCERAESGAGLVTIPEQR